MNQELWTIIHTQRDLLDSLKPFHPDLIVPELPTHLIQVTALGILKNGVVLHLQGPTSWVIQKTFDDLRSLQSLGLDPEGTLDNLTWSEGTRLTVQNTLNTMILSAEHSILSSFLTSNRIKLSVQVQEPWIKVGILFKKGKNFGVKILRTFWLSSLGTLMWSDTKEFLGSIDLNFCYCARSNEKCLVLSEFSASLSHPSSSKDSHPSSSKVSHPSSSKVSHPSSSPSKDSDHPSSSPSKDSDHPSSSKVIPSKVIPSKDSFKTEVSNDSAHPFGAFTLGPDGLPSIPYEKRYVLYAETEQDRDDWVKCIAGQIARLRPNDVINRQCLNQVDFMHSSPPVLSLPEMTPSHLHFKDPSSPVSNPLSPLPVSSIVSPLPVSRPLSPLPVASPISPLFVDQPIVSVESVKSLESLESLEGMPDEDLGSRLTLATRDDFGSKGNLGESSRVEEGNLAESRVSLHVEEGNLVEPRLEELSKEETSKEIEIIKLPTGNIDEERIKSQLTPLKISIETASFAFIPRVKEIKESKLLEKRHTFWTKRKIVVQDIPSKTLKPVFGLVLAESVENSRVKSGLELSSVIYRCIEYIDFKDGHLEEGLYRLSGSSSTIQSLKSRFDIESDVPLLDGEYDVHAVSGLLKLYLRELKETVLTIQLRKHFLKVSECPTRNEKIDKVIELVSYLPLPNYTLLKTLSSHLIRIIQHSQTNKMSVKNINIVFSPTLGVPAGVFSIMMGEFDRVFSFGLDDLARFQNPVEVDPSPSSIPPLELVSDSDHGGSDPVVSDDKVESMPAASESDQAVASEKQPRLIPHVEKETFTEYEMEGHQKGATIVPVAQPSEDGMTGLDNLLSEMGSS